MTNNDRDIFSQVISTGSRDQEIEVSLSSFSSLPNDALEPVLEVKAESSTDSPDHRNRVQRHALSSSFESKEENDDAGEAFFIPEDETVSDLDCILAEAEGELIALLGVSITKSRDSDDSLVNLDFLRTGETEKETVIVEKEMNEKTEMIDLPTLVDHGDKTEVVVSSTLTVSKDEKSILGTPEVAALEFNDEFDDELKLANVIEEDSVETEDAISVQIFAAQTANGEDCVSSPHIPSIDSMVYESLAVGSATVVTDETLVKNAAIQTSAVFLEAKSTSATFQSPEISEALISVIPIQYLAEKIGVADLESEFAVTVTSNYPEGDAAATRQQNGESSPQQCNGVPEISPTHRAASDVLEDGLHPGADVSFSCATSKLDHAIQPTLDADGYDEEKKWDVNSIPYESSDAPVYDNEVCRHGHNKSDSSTHTQAQSDSMEKTETGNLEPIDLQPDSSFLAGKRGRLPSRTGKEPGLLTADQEVPIEDDVDPLPQTKRQINSNVATETSPANCRDELDPLRIATEYSNVGGTPGDAAQSGCGYEVEVPQIGNEVADTVAEASGGCEDKLGALRIANEELNYAVLAKDGRGKEFDKVYVLSDDTPTAIEVSDGFTNADGDHRDEIDPLQVANEDSDGGTTTCDAAPCGCEDEVDVPQMESEELTVFPASIEAGADDCRYKASNDVATVNGSSEDEIRFSRIVIEETNVTVTVSETSTDAHEDAMETQLAVNESNIAKTARGGIEGDDDHLRLVKEEKDDTVTGGTPNRSEEDAETLQIANVGLDSVTASSTKITCCREDAIALPVKLDFVIPAHARYACGDGARSGGDAPRIANEDSNVTDFASEELFDIASTTTEYQGEGARDSTYDYQKVPESSRPPLFPSKRGYLHENPEELLNFLSSKLNSQKSPQGDMGSITTTRTVDRFDPDLSVFARTENDLYETSDISPPGSPAEPFFDGAADESSSDESCSVPSRLALFALAHPEIAPWDMIPPAFPWLHNASIHPELIVTGDLVDDSEILLQDSDRGHMTWTGASFPDFELVGYKEPTGSVKSTTCSPSQRTTLGPVTIEKPVGSSASEPARRLQRMPLAFATSRCRNSPRFRKRRSKTPYLSLSKSAEEPSSPLRSIDAQRLGEELQNGSSRHLSKLRGTFSVSNLQSLEDCSSYFSLGADAKEKGSLQFWKESFAMGDREVQSDLLFAQPIHAVLPSPKGMHGNFLAEELLPLAEVKEMVPSLQCNHDECVRYIASLQWKQLQASWLHDKVARSSLLNQQLKRTDAFSYSDESSFSTSVATSHCMTVNSEIGGLKLDNVPKHWNINGSAKTINDLLRLSAYFSWNRTSHRSHLKHSVPLEKGKELESLLMAASSRLSAFSGIVQGICGYAVLDDVAMDSKEDKSGVRYFIGIKKARALQLKATRKYGGDILQVKDVLRGSIVFPNEGTLLCGLFRLFQIENTNGGNTKSKENETKVRIARVKNLFQESSPVGGLVHSSLPSGYRHVLVNVEMNDEFIAEIQFNLSAFYNVLGDEGPILHQDLSDLHDAMTSRSSELTCLDISKLIECATGIVPPRHVSESQVVREDGKAAASENVEGLGTETSIIDLPTTITGDSKGVLQYENIRWTAMDFGGFITEKSKDEFLNELRKETTTLSDGELSLALLECASVFASEKPEDAACSFCLCLIILYHVRSCPAEQVSTLCDAIGEPVGLLRLAHSRLVNCLSLCSKMNSDRVMGRLEHAESTAFTHQNDVSADVLNLLAFLYAEDARWNDAASVLETLILQCETFFTGANPILITSLLDLASMTRRAGNHSHASSLLARATESVSMLLVEKEASYIEYLLNASKDATKEAPFFCMDIGRDAFESLRQFIIALQEVNGQTGLQRFRDPWICSIYHRIIGDSFAVLANCEQATWIHLPTKSTTQSHMETIRYFWSLALSHFEKAFAGFSAVAGFENCNVSGAVFGVTRCLRELGETEKALELLSMVVAGLENVAPMTQDPLGSVLKPSSTSYLSRAMLMAKRELSYDHPQVHHHIMRALCLWWMSILSVDKSKCKDGRNRSFRFLHTSSISLQLALTEMYDSDEKTRKVCVDFLEKIELEAKNISQQQ